jgi:hypothetical protein
MRFPSVPMVRKLFNVIFSLTNQQLASVKFSAMREYVDRSTVAA